MKNNEIKIFVENNIRIDSIKNIANTFNEYYNSIDDKLINNIK